MSTLLALSDMLVIRALERCASRGLSGDARRDVFRRGPRCRAYELKLIPPARHDHALEGAWDILPEIVDDWQVAVDAQAWATVLDDYCRRLLSTQRPRNLDALDESLRLLGAGHAA